MKKKEKTDTRPERPKTRPEAYGPPEKNKK